MVGQPNGLVAWTAQTRTSESKCIAPYYFNDPEINGFRATHWQNDSCGQDYGSFTIMPTGSKIRTKPLYRASMFSHQYEVVSPTYYSVELDNYRILAEMTATQRASLMKFTFGRGGDNYLILEPNSDEGKGRVEVRPENREVVIYNPINRNSGQKASWYVIQFDTPFIDFGTYKADSIFTQKKTGQGQNVGAFLKFSMTPQQYIKVKIGTSFTDEAGARKNLLAEINHWDLGKTIREAEKAWNQELEKVRFEGNEDAKTQFYTTSYSKKIVPRLFLDVDGQTIK